MDNDFPRIDLVGGVPQYLEVIEDKQETFANIHITNFHPTEEFILEVSIFLTNGKNAQIKGTLYTPEHTHVLLPPSCKTTTVTLEIVDPSQPFSYRLYLKASRVGHWTKKNLLELSQMKSRKETFPNKDLETLFVKSKNCSIESYEHSSSVGMLLRHIGDKPNENVEFVVENMRDHGIIFKLTLNNEEFQDLLPAKTRTLFWKAKKLDSYEWLFEKVLDADKTPDLWRSYTFLHPLGHHFPTFIDLKSSCNLHDDSLFRSLCKESSFLSFQRFKSIMSSEDPLKEKLTKLIQEAKTQRQSFSNQLSNEEDVEPVFNSLQAPINYTKFMVAELKELKGLVDEGILTAEEFQEEKQVIRQKYRKLQLQAGAENITEEIKVNMNDS